VVDCGLRVFCHGGNVNMWLAKLGADKPSALLDRRSSGGGICKAAHWSFLVGALSGRGATFKVTEATEGTRDRGSLS